jgi:CheY-like chemotaxis protein
MAINILLVEDNAFIRKFTLRLFHELGYQVDSAKNYQEAINLISTNTYDLVLTDIGLPDQNGIAVTQRLREIEAKEKRSNAYVCGATAFALDEYSTACQYAGMNDLAPKPINLSFLEKLVQVATKIQKSHEVVTT